MSSLIWITTPVFKRFHRRRWLRLGAALMAVASLTIPPSWAKGERSENAAAKGETSGGGDRYCQDAMRTAHQEVYPLIRAQPDRFPGIDAEKFKQKADVRRCESKLHVYESCDLTETGREVEMCFNENTDMFYVSRTLYPLAEVNAPPKRSLIAHEIYRRMALEGDRYARTLMQDFGSGMRDNVGTFLYASDSERYIRDFPSVGIDRIVYRTPWYRADANGNELAQRNAFAYLAQALKTGVRKDLMEQLIEYETRTQCDLNVDYARRTETNSSRNTYEHASSAGGTVGASRGSGSKGSAGASAVANGTSGRADAYTDQSEYSYRSAGGNFYSRESGSGTSEDFYRVEEREVYCQRPSTWVRAVVRASAKLSLFESSSLNYFVNLHIGNTLSQLTESADQFLRGIDKIILSPAVTASAADQGSKGNSQNSLYSWLSLRMSQIEIGKNYVAFIRKTFPRREYEAEAVRFDNLVATIASRVSQVEAPGLYAVSLNASFEAQASLLIDLNALRRLDPQATFTGHVANRSLLTDAYLRALTQTAQSEEQGRESSARCDAAYQALLAASRSNPVKAIAVQAVRFLTESRTAQAEAALQCRDRYTSTTLSFELDLAYSADRETEGGFNPQWESSVVRPLTTAHLQSGCIPYARRETPDPRYRGRSKFYSHTIHSICPIRR